MIRPSFRWNAPVLGTGRRLGSLRGTQWTRLVMAGVPIPRGLEFFWDCLDPKQKRALLTVRKVRAAHCRNALRDAFPAYEADISRDERWHR